MKHSGYDHSIGDPSSVRKAKNIWFTIDFKDVDDVFDLFGTMKKIRAADKFMSGPKVPKSQSL